MMALSLLGEMVHMEEIRVQFSHLFQVELLKSSQQNFAFAALKDDGSVVTWGEDFPWRRFEFSFLHLFQVGLLKSSPLKEPLPPLKMMALSLLGEMVPMEEIRVHFLHLSMELLKSSQQIMPLPPLKMMALSLLGEIDSYGGDSSSVFYISQWGY